jgi:mercuric ion transport protein
MTAYGIESSASSDANTASVQQSPGRNSLLGATLAGIVASACCAGPAVLVLAGASGAWIGGLEVLTPYRPFFIAATVAFFGFAGYRLFFSRKVCAPGSACAVSGVLRRQRIIFFAVLAAVAVWIAFPWYATYLL